MNMSLSLMLVSLAAMNGMQAGLIGDMFGNLFQVIWDGVKWIGTLLKSLFQSLINILIKFFKWIYYVLDGFLYFLYMVGVVAAKVFNIFYELGRLLLSIFVGFAKTLTSLTYTPAASANNGFSSTIGKLVTIANDHLQLQIVAYILLFAIWFMWVVTAMKLLSSIRVGGD